MRSNRTFSPAGGEDGHLDQLTGPAGRYQPPPRAPGARETTARRPLARLADSGFIERLRVGRFGVWAVPTTRGLRMAGLPYGLWQPSAWKLRRIEAVSRLRLWLADQEPTGTWVCERELRHRWHGSGPESGSPTVPGLR
jgi:hypothetical protein